MVLLLENTVSTSEVVWEEDIINASVRSKTIYDEFYLLLFNIKLKVAVLKFWHNGR